MPMVHKVEINVEARSSVSVSGKAFKAGVGKATDWFRSFFSGISQMTIDRQGEQLLTATSVGGLTLAHRYLGDAVSYVSAARKLDESEGEFSPKYFLLCHALELALKAYILATGGTEKDTKKIKHDLELAWGTAIKNGLVSKNPDLSKLIERVALAHSDYSFRYNKTCTFILPQAQVFEVAVSGLIDDVMPVVQPHLGVLKIS
jgi:hypothetical protein